MKVAYITVHLPGVGSGEEFLVPEIRHLAEHDCDLILVPRETRARGPGSFENHQRVIVKTAGLYSREVIWALVRTAVTNWKLTSEIVRECCRGAKPLDLVKNFRVLPKGVWLGQLVRKESIDHIHAHWGATTATIAEIAHRVSGAPWSLTLHRGDIVQNNRLAQKLRSASFTRFISRDGIRLYKEVTGRDPHVANTVKVVHMGVTIPPSETLPPLPRTKPFNLICAANLVPVKGHIFLLRAMRALLQRHVPVRLFLAGEGPLRTELEEWVRAHDLEESVTFLGQVTHRALLDGYRKRAYHAVVLASVDLGSGHHEGIPVSLIEGMAFGLPVISTASGGIPELLDDGAGILVPPQNAERLADAIGSLAADYQLSVATGRAGRERVISQFDASRIAAILVEAFGGSTAEVTSPVGSQSD